MISRTNLLRGATALGLAALLAGCAPTGNAGGPNHPADVTPSATPTVDLSVSLLGVEDFPLKNWAVTDTYTTPTVDAPTAPSTVSAGAGSSANPPASLCETGAVEKMVGLNEPGVSRIFTSQTNGISRYTEGLYPDAGGKLADSMRSQIEACAAAGPVSGPMGSASLVSYTWSSTHAGNTTTAKFSDPESDSLVIMFSIAHVGDKTMVGSALLRSYPSTQIQPDDYASIVAAATAKL